LFCKKRQSYFYFKNKEFRKECNPICASLAYNKQNQNSSLFQSDEINLYQYEQGRVEMLKKTFLLLAMLSIASFGALAQSHKPERVNFNSNDGEETQATLIGGQTSVNLSGGFRTALGTLGIRLGRITPARVVNTRATFPIADGLLDLSTGRGEIYHTGGLRLTKNNTQLKLQNFIIDTTGQTPVLTGLASVNGQVVGRIPLFNLQLPADGADDFSIRFVNIRNVGVTLRPEAAQALNQVFNTTAFTPGFNIGTASVFGIGLEED
jgi:hypothetical protein